MQSPPAAAKLFRDAVSAGAFVEAQQLIERYRLEVEASWRAATSLDELRAISMEVAGLLDWARTMTLSARSHAQRKLILLDREGAYAPSIRKNELLNLNA